MAIIKCKECGGKVSTEAAACPSCGAKPQRRTSTFTWVVGGFFALVVLIGIVNGDRRSTEAQAAEAALTPEQRAAATAAKARAESISSAQYACEQFATQSLHDPKSAEMDDFRTFPQKEEKPNQWLVQVSGRAKNAFNALRQVTILCRVRLDAGNYRLVKIEQVN